MWADWEGRFFLEEEENNRTDTNAEPTEPSKKDDLMIAEETRDELRVTPRTLYRYDKSSKLTRIKMDGRLLFDRANVARFKEKCTIRAKSILESPNSEQ